MHPKDIQDGLVAVTENDILANVPYIPGCGLWFDHHAGEDERGLAKAGFQGDSRPAPSAARVIYEHYGGKARFSERFDGLIAAVDKADAAQFTVDEILHPTGWVLLSFVMDPRTGLGRYKDYRISNYRLMEDMIGYCRRLTVDEILQVSDVQERVERYFQQDALFGQMITAHSRTDGNVVVTDLRRVEPIYTGNRFVIYSLYPDQNISIWMIDGRNKQNCVFAVGHSITNRTARTDVGSLLLKYGGGGHREVGTCQVPYADADRVLGGAVGPHEGTGLAAACAPGPGIRAGQKGGLGGISSSPLRSLWWAMQGSNLRHPA